MPRAWRQQPLTSTNTSFAIVQQAEESLRLRVLHVCPYMHPSAGGPPVVVERLCSSAQVQGWDAAVISTSLYCEDDGRDLQARLRKTMEIEVLPMIGPRAFKRSRGLSAIDKGVRGADIVHAHTL